MEHQNNIETPGQRAIFSHISGYCSLTQVFLSMQLKSLLTGPSWHPPFYADDNLMAEYVTTLERLKGPKPKIEQVL